MTLGLGQSGWGSSLTGLALSRLNFPSFETGGKADKHDVFPSLEPIPSTGTIVTQVPSVLKFWDRVLTLKWSEVRDQIGNTNFRSPKSVRVDGGWNGVETLNGVIR